MHTLGTIRIGGYTVNIHQDEMAQNPWEVMDCLPPCAVWNDGRVTRYGDFPSLLEILNMRKDMFERGPCVRTVRSILGNDVDLIKVAKAANENGCLIYGVAHLLEDENGAYLPERMGYRDAKAAMDSLEQVCKVLGIAAYASESHGHSQRNYAYCIYVATPQWLEEMGMQQSEGLQACKCAHDTFSAWAWGDVYGYTVTDPAGKGVDGAGCWGFYGSNHEESGLMEYARDNIRADIAHKAKESAEAFRAACSDIATI